MCEVQHHYNFQLTSATPVFIRKGCTDATTIRAQRQAFLNTGIILNSGVSTDIYFFCDVFATATAFVGFNYYCAGIFSNGLEKTTVFK